jgi:Trypsin-like peptidase domain/Ankyrin repeats (3 copies)
MQKYLSLTVASGLLLSLGAQASFDVVYGEDNRVEVFEAPSNLRKLAESTATMISKDKILTTDGKMSLSQQTFRESNTPKDPTTKITFCKDLKYVDQPNPGMCSGFLIAPDLLMTAGHCVALENFCENYKWVFDFKVDKNSMKAGMKVSEKNVYSCKKVLSNSLNSTLGLDYGLVLLDRKVEDRKPLEMRQDKSIKVGEGLVVIGSPSGLPLKVADGATVRSVPNPFFFKANLDTFSGNSGSAVFNAATGVVEGILVRGEDDFEVNKELMCVGAKKCPIDGCRGEDVSKITSVPEISVQKLLTIAAEAGDVETVKKVLKLKTWIDFSDRNGVTVLMRAVRANQTEVVKLLLEAGADPLRTDRKGNSSAKLAKKNSLEEIKDLF